MSLLDGIATLFVLFFAWKGFHNGLVREIFRIVGLVLAGFVAFEYSDEVAIWIQSIYDSPIEYLVLFSFALLFVLALIIVQITIMYLDKLLHVLLLSTPNRILGSLFGIVKSSLLLSIILIFLAGFSIPAKDTRQQSLLYFPLLHVAPQTFDIAAHLLPGIQPYKDSVDRYLSIPDVTD